MEQTLHAVMLDFEHLTLISIALGLIAYAALRAAMPPSHVPGKVRTEALGGVDLIAVFLLIAFFYLSFLSDPLAPTDRVMSLNLIVAGLVMNLFLMTIVLVTVQWVGGRNPVDLFGLSQVNFPKWLLWVIGGILLSTPLVLFLSDWMRHIWLEPLFGEIKEQEVVDSMKNASSIGLKTGMIISACLIAPLVEEVVFRGYIYGVLKQFTHPLFATLTAGALFAAVHLNLPALVPLWIFAIILTLAYELSGSLWVPIGIHAGFNTISVIALLQESGQ